MPGEQLRTITIYIQFLVLIHPHTGVECAMGLQFIHDYVIFIILVSHTYTIITMKLINKSWADLHWENNQLKREDL